MKRKTLGAALLAALLAACSTAPKAPVETAAPRAITRECTLSLWGDSIMYGGYGASLANRIAEPPAAALRRIRPAWRVADHSVVGDSAHQRLQAFMTRQLNARYVVLQYGMNDAGQGYSDYEASLRAMVEHVKHEGKTPIITGISHVMPGQVGQRDAYDAAARRVAASTGTAFADWGSVLYRPADMADGIHPAQAYSERLVERLAATLDRVAPQCAT